MSRLPIVVDGQQARAEEVARDDAMLFGACGEAYLEDRQTRAKIFDIEPGALSPYSLWNRLRPLVVKAG